MLGCLINLLGSRDIGLEYIGPLFVSVSLLIGAWQDLKERQVYLLLWIPAAIGIFFWPFNAAAAAIVAGMLLVCLVFRFANKMGGTDVIAFPLIMLQPSVIAQLEVLYLVGVAAAAHWIWRTVRKEKDGLPIVVYLCAAYLAFFLFRLGSS